METTTATADGAAATLAGEEEGEDEYQLPAPALPVSCEFSEEELRRRMRMGFPAATAGEYLARVRLEAAAIPDVMVSDVDPRRFDALQTVFVANGEGIARPPPGMAPDPEWRARVLESFVTLNANLVKRRRPVEAAQKASFPGYQDEKGWLVFLGIVEDDEGKIQANMKNKLPLVSLVSQLDQVRTNKALLHISRFLGRPETSGQLLTHDHRWGSHLLMWIFALFANLEEPSPVATLSNLRTIAKLLSYSRKKLTPGATSQILSPLNLIICIVEDHFKQGDPDIPEPLEPPPRASNNTMDDLFFEEEAAEAEDVEADQEQDDTKQQ